MGLGPQVADLQELSPRLAVVCTFNARRAVADIRYQISNCELTVILEDGIAFEVKCKPPVRIAVSKRCPKIVDT